MLAVFHKMLWCQKSQLCAELVSSLKNDIHCNSHFQNSKNNTQLLFLFHFELVQIRLLQLCFSEY